LGDIFSNPSLTLILWPGQWPGEEKLGVDKTEMIIDYSILLNYDFSKQEGLYERIYG